MEPIEGELMTESAIATTQPDTALSVARAPRVVVEEARLAARALAEVIESKRKKVVLNGKTYLTYEDWQTVARFYGVTAKVLSTQYIEYGEVRGFEAHAVALLLTNGMEISAADAMCLNDEPKWDTRTKYAYVNGQRKEVGQEKVPFFQLRSMAQTRACAKALRNVLAFVPVLAGYEPTPAEEMDGSESHNSSSEPTLQPPAKKAPDTGKSVLLKELGDGNVSLYGDGMATILISLGDAGKEKLGMVWQGAPNGWVMPMKSSFALEDVCNAEGVGFSYVGEQEKPATASQSPANPTPQLGRGKITNTELATGKKGEFMRVWQEGNKMQAFDNPQMRLADGTTMALFTMLKLAKGKDAIFRVNKVGNYFNIVGVEKLGNLSWDETGTPVIQR